MRAASFLTGRRRRHTDGLLALLAIELDPSVAACCWLRLTGDGLDSGTVRALPFFPNRTTGGAHHLTTLATRKFDCHWR
ncbi:MAG: hypothetical protein MK364_15895 [Pirellulales bacterium]|nr:hypothetical protein [Pirellulales bacterium]